MDESPVRGGYAGRGVPPEVKSYAAEVALALQDKGWSVPEIVLLLQGTSYGPKQRTLERHLGELKKGGTPLSTEKVSGRRPKLSEKQWEVVAGWILTRQEPVDLQTISSWISSNIGITVDESTVSHHLKSLELSLQLFGSRPMPAGKTRDEYVLGYFEFVKKLNDEGFFNWNPSKIVCIDSLTDSRRTERGSAGMSDSEPDEEEKDVQACVRRKREVQVEQDSVKARELEEMEEEECLEKMPPKAPLLLLSFEEILGPEGLEKLNALEFKYLEYDSQPTSQTIRHFTMIIREGPGRSENERMVALFALRHFEGIKSLRRVAEMTTSGSFSGVSLTPSNLSFTPRGSTRKWEEEVSARAMLLARAAAVRNDTFLKAALGAKLFFCHLPVWQRARELYLQQPEFEGLDNYKSMWTCGGYDCPECKPLEKPLGKPLEAFCIHMKPDIFGLRINDDGLMEETKKTMKVMMQLFEDAVRVENVDVVQILRTKYGEPMVREFEKAVGDNLNVALGFLRQKYCERIMEAFEKAVGDKNMGAAVRFLKDIPASYHPPPARYLPPILLAIQNFSDGELAGLLEDMQRFRLSSDHMDLMIVLASFVGKEQVEVLRKYFQKFFRHSFEDVDVKTRVERLERHNIRYLPRRFEEVVLAHQNTNARSALNQGFAPFKKYKPAHEDF